jgi:hypothetical protein
VVCACQNEIYRRANLRQAKDNLRNAVANEANARINADNAAKLRSAHVYLTR